jgi:hypothetical protein
LVYPHGVVRPEDLLTFVHFNHFTREWKRIGLTDEDLRALEIGIMAGPAKSPIIPGTGGLRKIRFSSKQWNRGKSGGVRIGYCYIEEVSVVGLIVVFPKSGKANLTMAERREIKELLDQWRKVILA